MFYLSPTFIQTNTDSQSALGSDAENIYFDVYIFFLCPTEYLNFVVYTCDHLKDLLLFVKSAQKFIDRSKNGITYFSKTDYLIMKGCKWEEDRRPK